MIPGITASTGLVSGVVNPAPTALIYMDFMTETFWMDGVEVTLGDIVDRTDMAMSAEGAYFDWSTSDTPPRFNSAAMTIFNANSAALTVVTESKMDSGSETNYHDIFYMIGPDTYVDGSYDWSFFIEMETRNSILGAGSSIDGSFNEFCTESGTFAANTVYRLAYAMRTSGYCYGAYNGIAMTNQGTVQSPGTVPSFKHAVLGGLPEPADNYINMKGYLRKFEVYGAKTNTEVVALSVI